MTDKEKIRKEVERLRNLHQMKYQQLDTNDNMCLVECGKRNLCNHLLLFIDSLQEEPVSEDTMTIRKEWFEHCKESWYNEGYIDGKYNRDRQFKEPVSEELEEAAFYYAEACKYDGGEKLLCVEHFKAGAKWHKEQFEKNRLAHCDELTAEQAQIESDFVIEHLKENNRTPTFIDAIEYGMKVQEEKVMKDATEVTVHIDAGGYPYIPQMELYDYDKDVPLAKEGDKYKVVLIKEG